MRMTSRTLIDLLGDQAAIQPDRQAYTFLDDGEHPGEALTWAGLERRSRAIAARLSTLAAPGDRVLVLCQPGLEFVPAFFGTLFAGAIAVPAYPPAGARADRVATRLAGMIADAGVSVVLSTAAVAQRRSAVAALVEGIDRLPWLVLDGVDDAAAETWRPPVLTADPIAFLQYTSGSTAAPRGVVVTHANLRHNMAVTHRDGGYTEDSVSLSWLPVNHDMGLINGVLQPAFSGCRAYLMAPAAFLQRPFRWLNAISRLGATHSGGPNFAYDLCTRRVRPEEREALHLGSWQVAYNGSEPVRRSTLEHFQAAFGSCGFRWEALSPAFGLAESTLLVASVPAGVPPHVEGTLVASGVLGDGAVIRIVDPERLTPCGDGEPGEIWVSSDSVAAGYWNRPQETRATFGARVAETGEGPFLRTGDLGSVRGGRLFVNGRIKDLLIVRGVKHHPQDLEATAERAHPDVRPGCCAAFATSDGEEERVAVIAELDPRAEATAGVLSAIRSAIAAAHQVAPSFVAVVEAGTLPKTTSGKLQRYLCREALEAGTLAPIAAWNDLDAMRAAS